MTLRLHIMSYVCRRHMETHVYMSVYDSTHICMSVYDTWRRSVIYRHIHMWVETYWHIQTYTYVYDTHMYIHMYMMDMTHICMDIHICVHICVCPRHKHDACMRTEGGRVCVRGYAHPRTHTLPFCMTHITRSWVCTPTNAHSPPFSMTLITCVYIH